jgi:hypothetical protein
MKVNKLLIALIVLNIGLAGAVAYLLKRESAPPVLVNTPLEPSTPAQVVEKTKFVATITTNTVQVDWNMVESDDYKKYIANLRSIGCPPETVRDIILADVTKLFAARFAALTEPPRTNDFWKRAPVRGADEERVKQRLAILKEKKALLKELLGEDIDVKDEAAPGGSDPRSEMLSFLPKEKIQQISEMDATYDARINKLLGNKIRPSAEEVKEFNRLEAEKRAELTKVLSPQELEDYNLRASRTANVLRATMGEFAMTEQEFRDVFKVRQQFDEQYGVNLGFDDANRAAARWETERQVRATMGDERYTQYVRERDWSMSSLQNIAQDFGIPKEQAVQVFDVKLAAQQQSDAIRFNQQIDEAQRQAELQALQEQAKGQVARILGEKAMDAYTKEGFWIRNLAR